MRDDELSPLAWFGLATIPLWIVGALVFVVEQPWVALMYVMAFTSVVACSCAKATQGELKERDE